MNQDYAATVLAVAGLKRLQATQYIRDYLDPQLFIPAIGQGAIGIECRADDTELRTYLATINHEPTACCIQAERAFNGCLGGDCHTPLGAYATLTEQQLTLTAMVASDDGQTILRSQRQGPSNLPTQLGEQVAEDLLAQGAYRFVIN